MNDKLQETLARIASASAQAVPELWAQGLQYTQVVGVGELVLTIVAPVVTALCARGILQILQTQHRL